MSVVVACSFLACKLKRKLRPCPNKTTKWINRYLIDLLIRIFTYYYLFTPWVTWSNPGYVMAGHDEHFFIGWGGLVLCKSDFDLNNFLDSSSQQFDLNFISFLSKSNFSFLEVFLVQSVKRSFSTLIDFYLLHKQYVWSMIYFKHLILITFFVSTWPVCN